MKKKVIYFYFNRGINYIFIFLYFKQFTKHFVYYMNCIESTFQIKIELKKAIKKKI
jgi:hypothetical protein